ncbi:MAG: lysylphosphatidylglycerol synthase domain-containing protein [Candidatus Binatia bacterium]|nr:lysylphosphatidylglycerol synthase domain-containing protein [Candidatus Binatia bacterium]
MFRWRRRGFSGAPEVGLIGANRLKTLARGGLLVGIVLFVALIAREGVGEVATALSVAGWGLLAVAAFHLVPIFADAMGWRRLLATRSPISIRTALYARWIGESVNGLLPVAQVGGSVVKANLVSRRGVPGAFAGASVVVDITTLVGSQIVFTLLGLALLIAEFGGHELAPTALAGTVLMALLLFGFYLAQRRGMFGAMARGLRRLAPGGGPSAFTDEAESIDADVAQLYGESRAVLAALAWHLVAWVVGAGEVWLALWLLGHPVDLSTALLLESLGQAVRAAAFAIPGALGVQEGGYVLLGQVLGIGPETALALSLSKRVRELTLGLPGLVAWQIEEANALLLPRSDEARMESL